MVEPGIGGDGCVLGGFKTSVAERYGDGRVAESEAQQGCRDRWGGINAVEINGTWKSARMLLDEGSDESEAGRLDTGVG